MITYSIEFYFYICNDYLFQNDIEIPVPKYFIFENAKALKEKEKLMGSILARKGPVDTEVVRIIRENDRYIRERVL